MRKTLQPPPATAGIAWPARALDRRAARRGPGGVRARVVHLAGRGRRPGPLLAHRRPGHLLDLPPAAHPPQLRPAAPVARIPLHGHRLLCLGGRCDRLGRRPPQAPRPRRRRARRPQPRPRPRLGAHALVDDARRHPHPRPRIRTRSGHPTSLATRSTACSTGSTSSSRSCCSRPFTPRAACPGWSGAASSGRAWCCTRPGWSTRPPTSGATAAIQTRDTSTNLWWVALLTFGEGWHNNHHASQTSARHGLRWWELDATYWAIRLMALVGLAHGVKRPRTIPAPRSPRAFP